MGRIREQHLLQNNSCWQCNCIKKIKIPLHVHRENERKTKNDWKNEMNVEKPLIWNWKGNESLSDDSPFYSDFFFLLLLLLVCSISSVAACSLHNFSLLLLSCSILLSISHSIDFFPLGFCQMFHHTDGPL